MCLNTYPSHRRCYSVAIPHTVTHFTPQWYHQYDNSLLGTAAIITLLTIIQWWWDVTRKGTYQGLHTKIVTKVLWWGIILFIASEVLFSVSIFWEFVHTSLSPTIELGSTSTSTGIQPFYPTQVPLLDKAMRLASGVTVTWAHHGLLLPCLFMTRFVSGSLTFEAGEVSDSHGGDCED